MKRAGLLAAVPLLLSGCGEDAVAPSGLMASFVVTPDRGSHDTDFTVDASGSSDAEDPVSVLQVRWDWEDDGTWDTDWTLEKTATHRYASEGTRGIRLEVRNRSGRTSQATRDVEVWLNAAPETEVSLVGTALQTRYDVSIAWSGHDPDGAVAGFLVGWNDPTALEFVTDLDSSFTLAPDFRDHTFYCAARDAEGRVDPTPATLGVNVPHAFLSSPRALIDGLAFAYRFRDFSLFAVLMANDPARNADFLFLLSEPTEEGDTMWGFQTEARLHRRMFHPETVLPGENPVPADIWLESVDITLTPITGFDERLDLYSADGGADGKLVPEVWRATSALYATSVFLAMVGETDYQVSGQAEFVVVEDRAKPVGIPGKFLLFLWEDIGVLPVREAPMGVGATWGDVKSLYR